MKDYRAYITMEKGENIMQSLRDMGYETQFFCGSLLDNYLTEIGENNLKLGRVKVRKYMIISEKYVNAWTSKLELIMTDNEKLFREYEKMYTENMEELGYEA